MNPYTHKLIEEYLEILPLAEEKSGSQAKAIAILQEINKDRRQREVRNDRQGNTLWATEKQIKLLRDMGVRTPDNLTRKEASCLIERHRLMHKRMRELIQQGNLKVSF